MKWRKFSISTLLLATAGFALLALLISHVISDVRLSRELSAEALLANEVIKSVGGGGISVVRVHGGPKVYNEFGFNLHSVTDQTIPELRRMNALRVEHLNLEYRPISDAGLNAISEFKYLRTLDLSGTDISDSSIALISKFDSLEKLDLSDTSVTDAALEELQKVESLKSVYLGNTRVTTNGLAELRSKRPSVMVITDVQLSGWGREERLEAFGQHDD